MKNHHHHNPIHPVSPAPLLAQTALEGAPPYEAIAGRAYALWEAQGHPENCDRAIWLEAEGQLLATPQFQPQRNLALSTDS